MTIQPRDLWVNVTFILDPSGAFSEPEDCVRFEQMVRTFPEASARRENRPRTLYCVRRSSRRRQQFPELVTRLLRHMDEKIGAA